MNNIRLNEIHIGHAILHRLEELQMTKSEFGRRIGVPQQHVNRIFEREHIDTLKLIKVCKALDFNFFSLFCNISDGIHEFHTSVTADSPNAETQIENNHLKGQLEICQEKIDWLTESKKLLSDYVVILKEQIELLKEKIQS